MDLEGTKDLMTYSERFKVLHALSRRKINIEMG